MNEPWNEGFSDSTTDAELALKVARAVTSWVPAGHPLDQMQGWPLVDMQNPGSNMGEMYVWGKLEDWQQRRIDALAQAWESEEAHRRFEEAEQEAVEAMRDMLLSTLERSDRSERESYDSWDAFNCYVPTRRKLHTYLYNYEHRKP